MHIYVRKYCTICACILHIHLCKWIHITSHTHHTPHTHTHHTHHTHLTHTHHTHLTPHTHHTHLTHTHTHLTCTPHTHTPHTPQTHNTHHTLHCTLPLPVRSDMPLGLSCGPLTTTSAPLSGKHEFLLACITCVQNAVYSGRNNGKFHDFCFMMS